MNKGPAERGRQSKYCMLIKNPNTVHYIYKGWWLDFSLEYCTPYGSYQCEVLFISTVHDDKLNGIIHLGFRKMHVLYTYVINCEWKSTQIYENIMQSWRACCKTYQKEKGDMKQCIEFPIYYQNTVHQSGSLMSCPYCGCLS